MQRINFFLPGKNADNFRSDLRWLAKLNVLVSMLSLALCDGIVRAQEVSSQPNTSSGIADTNSIASIANQSVTNTTAGLFG